MLKNILAIPGNQQVYKDLQNLLAKHKMIALVGAGASAGMYPLWGQLIEQLTDYAVTHGNATSKDRDRWRQDTRSTPQQRVNTIVRKLGKASYYQFLKDTFGPRRGKDGKRYTPIHAALLKLPFRGYATTNYDPALEFARMELRPECMTTGTPTWQDDDSVYDWLTGNVFQDAEGCPILWLHGIWQRPAGIILNASEYATAYKAGLYRRTFESIWLQDRLVSVGFGFDDPKFTFMIGEFLGEVADAVPLPPHIAILGIPSALDGQGPDEDAVAEWRENMRDDYHVRPLFYHVKKNADGSDDHQELLDLLNSLKKTSAVPHSSATLSKKRINTAHPKSTSPMPSVLWVHETTDDDKFIGREEEKERLTLWARDPATRIIGVCAIGGNGKTSLVGHWLKNSDILHDRQFVGLFAWSFYQESDSLVFLRELLVWASGTFGIPKPNANTALVAAALELTRDYPLIVVLDGLEILQEGPDASQHGAFLDRSLRDFLGSLCAQDNRSLAILTSRLVFADLERHLGTTFHQLELAGLPNTLGAKLLASLGVQGTESERFEVSCRLNGHPFGLRIFADAIPVKQCTRPMTFLEEAFNTGESENGVAASLDSRLRRLLVFYENKLPPTQVRLLSIIALFRSPVSKKIIIRLSRGLFGRKRKIPLPGDAQLSQELTRLHTRGILTYAPIENGHSYSCHPILRTHFRTALLKMGANNARRAASLLQGQPEEQYHNVKQIELVLVAIELLLEDGAHDEAIHLYVSRLNDGALFLSLPANLEGLRCAQGFIAAEKSNNKLESLSIYDLGHYLNNAALCARNTGNYQLAASLRSDHIALRRKQESLTNVHRGLINNADLLVSVGSLIEAVRSAKDSINITLKYDNKYNTGLSFADRSWILTLSGQLRAAAKDFAIAKSLAAARHNEGYTQHSHHKIRHTLLGELLLRTGHFSRALHHAEADLRICTNKNWNNAAAVCRWLIAACAVAENNIDKAESEIRQAETVFRNGQMLFDLARSHVTAGHVALARRNATTAYIHAAKALDLAQPRGIRIVHADALVLRGRTRLLEADQIKNNVAEGSTLTNLLKRAVYDAEYACGLARESGYIWAERDALLLHAEAEFTCADALRQVGNNSAADSSKQTAAQKRNAAELLASKLRLTETDLIHADKDAAEWLREMTEVS